MEEKTALNLTKCPNCGSDSIFSKILIEDKRCQYREVELACVKCSTVWREFYEKGILVKERVVTPQPTVKPDPIKIVKQCPYCGKYCDSQTGFPHLFQTLRVRQYAHQKCYAKAAAQFGPFPPTPYGPSLEAVND